MVPTAERPAQDRKCEEPGPDVESERAQRETSLGSTLERGSKNIDASLGRNRRDEAWHHAFRHENFQGLEWAGPDPIRCSSEFSAP
jgi:hypothetical protein